MAGGVVGPKGAGDRHRAWGFAAYMRHQILGKTQVSVRLSIATLATLLFGLAFGLQAPVYADDPDLEDYLFFTSGVDRYSVHEIVVKGGLCSVTANDTH